jgi:hypothetical protein
VGFSNLRHTWLAAVCASATAADAAACTACSRPSYSTAAVGATTAGLMSDCAATDCRYRFKFQKQLGLGFNKTDQQLLQTILSKNPIKSLKLTIRVRTIGYAYTVDLYPNPTAPLIPLYPNSPVGEKR